MPARRPRTPGTRDGVADFGTSTDQGKERMIAENTRVLDDVSTRLARLDARPVVEGSRSSGDALASLLDALAELGLITDRTTV
jgi:hypothetical protein